MPGAPFCPDKPRSVRRPRRAPRRRTLNATQRELVNTLLLEPYPYVEHELFNLPEREARRQIFELPAAIEVPSTEWYLRLLNGSAPAEVERPHETFVLTARQERVLFLQYNYCRYRAAQLVDQIRRTCEVPCEQPDPALAHELLDWHHQAQTHRNRIIEANLPLVLAMAKRVQLIEADYPDALGEANLDLMRAVELFDIARGYKFSTYACRAILNALRRVQRKGMQYNTVFPVDYDSTFESSDELQRRREQREDWLVDELHTIVRRNHANLTETERQVLRYRFAIPHDEDVEPAPRALTLAEVSQIKGFSKERARQIQKKALDKIRSLYINGDGESAEPVDAETNA